MSTATKTKPDTIDTAAEQHGVPALAGPRLPYHPAIEQRFGIDRASWKALVEAIFPGAQTTESVILALSYCRARKLDPFKRNVHIVPIWDSKRQCMVDTVWPGIGELRTTAFRTGEYAGRGATEFGPDKTETIGKSSITFPEWAQVTVYRMLQGQRVEFVGPRVYWIETYAVTSRNDSTPNTMWRTRVRGQLDKCSEAAALRAAFPEEIGSDYCHEEVGHLDAVSVSPTKPKSRTLDDLTDSISTQRESGEPLIEESTEAATDETTSQVDEYLARIQETNRAEGVERVLAMAIDDSALTEAEMQRVLAAGNDRIAVVGKGKK